MLRAVGLREEDLERPQVAVASSWNEVTPCNVHLNGLAAAAKEGVRQAGAVPLEFGTIAVSDGISMGTEGMKASLVSREIIADSVELMMQAEQFDALVAIAGCDKSLPGMLMACARLDVPAAFLYGGTILPGHALGRSLTIQDVFEAVGGHAAGEVSDADLLAVERAACPGAGSCAGHVHGQHHVGLRRGAGHDAARRGVGARGLGRAHRPGPAHRRGGGRGAGRRADARGRS